MAAVEIISAGYGIAKTVFSKKKEEGYGTTQPNTLAHAIDKLDKANDLEAVQIAQQALQLKVSGEGDRQIAEYIGSQLGYSPGDVYNSSKWAYIKRTLDSEAGQLSREISRQNNTYNNVVPERVQPNQIFTTPQPSPTQMPPAQSTQVGAVQQSNVRWGVIGAVAVILFTMLFK